MVGLDKKKLIPSGVNSGFRGDGAAGKLKGVTKDLKNNLGFPEENKEMVMDQETIESLRGNKKAILNYLKENCMTPKEGDEPEHVTEYGVEGIRYCLTLPSVKGSEGKGFKCKIIDWFVSDEVVSRYRYDKNQTWIDNSSTVEDISTKLFGNMRDFLDILGVSEDIGVDFVEELYYIYTFKTGESVKSVTGLEDGYFLKDRNEKFKDKDGVSACAGWRCCYGHCDFNWVNSGVNIGNLFLGLNVRELG